MVVTSDNPGPRTRRPSSPTSCRAWRRHPYQVICDRVEAIHWAMDHAQPGDDRLCGRATNYRKWSQKPHGRTEIVAEH